MNWAVISRNLIPIKRTIQPYEKRCALKEYISIFINDSEYFGQDKYNKLAGELDMTKNYSKDNCDAYIEYLEANVN